MKLKKKLKRLKARQADYDGIKDPNVTKGMKRPGSVNHKK